MTQFVRFALAGTLPLVFAMPGAAQRAPARDTLRPVLVPEITVTVTRTPVRVADLPQQVEVVTGREIRGSVATDMAELLKKQVALDVIQYPGVLAGIGIRGFRPQFSGINVRTLVLIDGRPAGTANIATLDLRGIERVEVLKGPASALYGSNAMGGVVNVVTRASRGAIGGTASAGYGSWETAQGTLGVGGNITSALDFDLSASWLRQGDDYRIGSGNLFRDRLGDGTVVRTLANGSADVVADLGDGQVRSFSQYGTRSGSLRLGYQWAPGWRVDARGERFSAAGVQNPGDIFFDTLQRSLKDAERASGDLALSGTLGGHQLRLRGWASSEDTDFYNRPTGERFVGFRTPTRWRGVQLQDAFGFGPHTLTTGFDYTAATAESEGFSAPGTRRAPFSPNSETRSAAAFAQGRFAFLDDRLVGTLGGRLDQVTFAVREDELRPDFRANSERHTVFNPSAGLQYRAPGGIRLHTSGGRAFVAPNAFNVAGYAETRAGARSVGLTRGNPDLRPETSVTWDAGVGLLRPEWGTDADVTFFHTDVRNRITSQRTIPTVVELTASGDTVRSVTSYLNADRAQIRGLEARVGYDFGVHAKRSFQLRPFASATRILEAREVSGTFESDIRNVADLTVVYGLEYDDFRRFNARFSGRYVGERLDSDFTDWRNPADVRYPRFMVLDLVTGVRLLERYRADLLLGNLTDENYYEVRGYPLPGRSVQLRLSVDF
ncbi:TonB-dependent receptor [soil metagenome]